MRAGHRTIGFRKFAEQPLHLVRREWRIDLDGGVTGDTGSNPRPDFFQVDLLLFALELVEELVQHAFHVGSLHAAWRGLHGDGSRPERLGIEAVDAEFVADLGEDRLLCRRELDDDRHQETLRLDLCGGTLPQHFFEQNTLMSDVLVDDPQTFGARGQDEAVAHLAQRSERCERSDIFRGFFGEHRRAAVVGSFGHERLAGETGDGNGGVGADVDRCGVES